MQTGLTDGVLRRLCGDEVGCATFFARHYGRSPVLFRGAADFACELASAEVCERLLLMPEVDVLLAREGRPRTNRPGLDDARALFAQGFTWVLRDVDRADEALAALGRGLASDLHGTLHLQLYRSPGHRFGFGWHFDPEEVFVFQTLGTKRFQLRENTQHPLPLAGQLPTRLEADAERTPIVEHTLGPGDALYIPSGWWHHAEATEESISISAGVLTPTFVDALQFIAAELARDPRWRQRLPPIGRATLISDGERQEVWSQSLGRLRAELEQRLGSTELPGRLFASTGWWRVRKDARD
jgi:50S ribosomal protein L16 3-hydroxylase